MIEVIVVRLLPDGEQRTVGRAPMQLTRADYTQFANRLPLKRLMGNAPPGDYALRFVRGDTILAEGRFSYSTIPTESARVPR